MPSKRFLLLTLPLVESQAMAAVLEAKRSGVCNCSDLQATLRNKAGEITQRIEDLQSLQSELNTMLESWQFCGGKVA